MLIDESWYIKPKDKNFPTQELAGGIVVRKDGDELLVALVGDRKFPNYILPKGRVERNETELAVAKREISEEMGLDKLVFIRKLSIKSRLTFKKTTWNTYHYFLFLTRQKDGQPQFLEGEEDYFLAWFPIDKLPPIFWPEQRELIEENREKIKKFIPSSIGR
ncbi:hypothetical protein A3A76_04860 [Candidatus Woesebacteria bacterium RIFCSPLOWO2_01_FULL_39_23]|uniref:Nudix hydrolase domain-containing protein n=2 Tax=Microgenomates group TaxID=1794810 RepID=A0A0H4T746_9BACT|nr:Uncharacterized protein [uncultured Microgenomates bacterium Rifle_16ft_4_minimus_37633]OGM13813.1 MAG: hypothetical protein A2141_04085 [Candidatus Woesebacteria bacterium RBG_16_40_11]OGM27763.1 MAG: hypothetical protein A2628_05080 [Candidatus Woesebacteria bacterium RIFCSPHIGHO2_01_FULL_40_22]OGM36054.1 MAG: hypothetical protein A3E41_04930 [Candidatus Woesebacteria bacterium RIFCSPHIGHO2_12_FULL_38_9]OGM62185.1 MAG: hypothetical protein A3A76_04860 [Candidatus Woesebacteria bacterium RI